MAKRESKPSAAGELPAAGSALERTEQTLSRLLETSGASVVFGKPIKHDDVLIIPAAEVVAGVGFGLGFGYGSGVDDETNAEGSGGGEGGGGGGKTFSRPVAVLVSSPDGIHVEPVADPTKVLLAAITAGGFMAAMLLRMISPRKALKEMRPNP
jgi:uncharacterized spore protein YtfJ